MTLEQIRELLTHATTGAYAGVAFVAIVQWRRRRSKPAGWLALTFLTIGLVVVVGEFLPDPPATSEVIRFIRRINVAILLLFPYFLFRFSASFEPASKFTETYASSITGLIIIWSFFIPVIQPGEPRPLSVRLFILVLLVQWVSLSAIVAARLWRQGRMIPAPVARRRMRLMAGAATLLAIALIMAGSSSDLAIGWRIVTQLLALAAAAGFYFGFSPPEWLRSRWRRPALEAVRGATSELISADSASEVTERLLPIMSGLVGAQGIAFFDKEGKILDQHGVNPSMLGAADGKLEGVSEQDQWDDLVVMRFPFGCLGVWTSPYSPFFGTEEFALLRSIGNLAHLALEQTRAAELKVQVSRAKLRRRQALEINDNIVQGLAVAKYAFELGDDEKGKAALDATLSAAKRIISELLEELDPGESLQTGLLVRERAATDISAET